MVVAVVVTVLYSVPIIYIAYISYKDAGQSYFQDKFHTNPDLFHILERGDNLIGSLVRFGDWFYLLMKRNDLGIEGMVLSFAIHF